MGNSTWSHDSYDSLKKDYSTKTTQQIFSNTSTHKDLSPMNLKFRECRDSDLHPESDAIIAFVDVTSSMGSIPEQLIRHKLGALMQTMIDHGVPHAQVLFGAIGDHHTDDDYIQVGQFEAGTDELNKCLANIHIEGGGGGQNMESYMLAWFVAGRHTSIDCFEKRGQKGFLFTIGDEWVHPILSRDAIKEKFGYDVETGFKSEDLLTEAQRMYEVFHIQCTQTSTGQQSHIRNHWKQLLGERVIEVDDYNNIAEIISTTVAVVRGARLSDVVKSFDSQTAGNVTNALVHVASGIVSTKKKEGVITL